MRQSDYDRKQTITEMEGGINIKMDQSISVASGWGGAGGDVWTTRGVCVCDVKSPTQDHLLGILFEINTMLHTAWL